MSSQSQCTSQTLQRKVKQQYVATKLCKFYLAGKCTRGTDCTFAHGEGVIRELPDYTKTRLCESFMSTGQCEQGSSCKFAHGKEEMQRQTAEMKKLKRRQKQTAKNSEAAEATVVAPPVVFQQAPAMLPTSQMMMVPVFVPMMMPIQWQDPTHNCAATVSDNSTDGASTYSSSGSSVQSRSNSTSPRALEHSRQEDSHVLNEFAKGNCRVYVKNTFLEAEDLDSSPVSPPQIPRMKTLPAIL